MFWLVRLAFVSAVTSIFVVKAYDQLAEAVGVNDAVNRVARPGVAVASWTAATTGMGMGGFKSKVRSLRRRSTGALNALTKRAGK